MLTSCCHIAIPFCYTLVSSDLYCCRSSVFFFVAYPWKPGNSLCCFFLQDATMECFVFQKIANISYFHHRLILEKSSLQGCWKADEQLPKHRNFHISQPPITPKFFYWDTIFRPGWDIHTKHTALKMLSERSRDLPISFCQARLTPTALSLWWKLLKRRLRRRWPVFWCMHLWKQNITNISTSFRETGK